MSFARVFLLAVLLLNAGCSPKPPSLRIAAAADLQFALGEAIKTFRAQHTGVTIEAVYGSSGNFYSNLVNHAPFDMYLSADVQYPHKLADQGLILPGSEFTYAVGRLVMWTDRASGIDAAHLGIDVLRQPSVHHIAIANPAHAPYGRAAEAALRSLGVYDDVKDKLVLGENISQAFQMVQSGAAEVGLVALALAAAPGVTGHVWEVPSNAYPPLRQGGAILKWTRDPADAQAFREFLLSPEGRAILKRYGFSGE